jgi:hypothetical protein
MLRSSASRFNVKFRADWCVPTVSNCHYTFVDILSRDLVVGSSTKHRRQALDAHTEAQLVPLLR